MIDNVRLDYEILSFHSKCGFYKYSNADEFIFDILSCASGDDRENYRFWIDEIELKLDTLFEYFCNELEFRYYDKWLLNMFKSIKTINFGIDGYILLNYLPLDILFDINKQSNLQNFIFWNYRIFDYPARDIIDNFNAKCELYIIDHKNDHDDDDDDDECNNDKSTLKTLKWVKHIGEHKDLSHYSEIYLKDAMSLRFVDMNHLYFDFEVHLIEFAVAVLFLGVLKGHL